MLYSPGTGAGSRQFPIRIGRAMVSSCCAVIELEQYAISFGHATIRTNRALRLTYGVFFTILHS